jgi:hypothetical protein
VRTQPLAVVLGAVLAGVVMFVAGDRDPVAALVASVAVATVASAIAPKSGRDSNPDASEIRPTPVDSRRRTLRVMSQDPNRSFARSEVSA